MPHQQKETSEMFRNTMKFLITKDYNTRMGYVQRCHNNKRARSPACSSRFKELGINHDMKPFYLSE
jgi:hypothetical protein